MPYYKGRQVRNRYRVLRYDNGQLVDVLGPYRFWIMARIRALFVPGGSVGTVTESWRRD